MYDANTRLRLLNELATCTYHPNSKDYVANIIMQIMNFPYKQGQARHFLKVIDGSKIVMVWLPMSVPFGKKSYSVPLQIFLMKNTPYEAPQIFVEVVQGSAINSKNKDIDINTRRILTNSLRSWSQYTSIDNVMSEILASFKNVFPIYKVKNPQQGQIAQNPQINPNYNPNNFVQSQPIQTQGIYNAQIQNSGQPYGYGIQQPVSNQNSGGYFFQSNTSIYGQPMVPQQPQAINPNPLTGFGQGSIYSQNSLPQPQPQVQPQIQQQQFVPQYGQQAYQPSVYQQSNVNYDEEFKKILLNAVFEKLGPKLTEENKRLFIQNKAILDYKNKFYSEGQKLKLYLNQQGEIKNKCDNDINKISLEIKNVNEYIENHKTQTLTPENCINYIKIQDPEALKIIADEANLEELMLVVRKGFEKKKISLEDTISFMRNNSRDIFHIKFIKKKIAQKYGGME